MRLPILLLLWVGVACATWTVAGWLRPVARPGLILICSAGEGPLLSLDSCAEQDAAAMAALTNVFDVSQATAESQSSAELQSLVDSLPGIAGRTRWFHWQRTATVVYVNAPGVAIPEKDGRLSAWILPDDFPMEEAGGRFRRDLAVSVENLLEQIQRLPTDQQLLVLDCQRMESLWPQGILVNQFVDAVREHLAEHAERYRSIHVLCSCSPGEVAWTDETAGQSVFGRAFVRGLAGAADTAGRADGRISLEELTDFVQRNVDSWVRENRADRQRPLLLTPAGAAESVVLAAINPSTELIADSPDRTPPGPRAVSRAEARLQAGWTEYARMRRQQPHPAQSVPHLWRELESALLRSEAFYRAGRAAALQNELQKMDRRLAELHTDLAPLYQPEHVASLALQLQFGPQHSITPATTGVAISMTGPAAVEQPAQAAVAPAPAAAPSSATTPQNATDPNTAEGPPVAAAPGTSAAAPGTASQPPPQTAPAVTTAAQLQQLLAAVVAGRKPPQAAARLLEPWQISGEPLPTEAELLRMLVEYSTDTAPAAAEIQQLVALRVLAEQAAVAAGRDAPHVFPWVRPLVDQADRQLRQREDLFFLKYASGSQAIELGRAKPSAAASNSLYEQAIKDGTTVAQAQAIRVLALAELPSLLRAAIGREWSTMGHAATATETTDTQSNGTLHRSVQELTRRMLAQVRELTGVLAEDPARWNTTQRRHYMFTLQSAARQLAATRQQVRELFNVAEQKLQRQAAAESLGSEADWRRINLLLTVPPVEDPSRTADELGARRMTLLRAVCKPVADHSSLQHGRSGNRQAAPAGRKSTAISEERVALVRGLVLDYLTLNDIVSPHHDRSDDPAGYSRSVAEAWAGLRAAAIDSVEGVRPARASLQAADIASRLLEPELVTRLFGSPDRMPTALARRQNLSDYLCWQTTRRLEDFWRGPPETGRDWFARVAGWTLDTAERLDAVQHDSIDNARLRLAELIRVARRLRQIDGDTLLTATPAAIRFRGIDREILRLSLKSAGSLPAGTAALTCHPDIDRLQLRPLVTTGQPAEVRPASGTRPAPATADPRTTDPGMAGHAAEWLLSRTGLSGFQGTLTARTFFRGHICQRRMAVTAVDETSGPTLEVRTTPQRHGELLVRWSRLATPASSVLFVLDCSRSMHRNQRLVTVQETLQQFAAAAGQGGLNVGIRVFGDRVVWRDRNDPLQEAAARRDSRLLLPLQPFPGEKFGHTVQSLSARGETPLFHALLQARQDFRQEAAGRKVIVLISDGADNWAGSGEKPGTNELAAAWKDSGIHLHCVGFQTDSTGWEQLQQIAAVTDGTCVQASQADELLENIFGMAGLYACEIARQQPDAAPVPIRHPLGFEASAVTVEPGHWDVRILRHDGTVAARREGIPIEPGQRHELHFTGERLVSPGTLLSTDVADARDSETGTLLRVLTAEPVEDGLELTVALQREGTPYWSPRQVRFRVRPRGHGAETVIDNPPRNVPGHAVPVWRFRIGSWPQDASFADISVEWSEQDGAARQQFSVNWSQDTRELALPPGFQLTRRRIAARTIDSVRRDTVLLTLVFPPGDRTPQEWSFGFRQPVRWSRETWNVQDGVYTGWFLLADADHTQPPRELKVLGPYDQAARHHLSASIGLQLRQINDLATRPGANRD